MLCTLFGECLRRFDFASDKLKYQNSEHQHRQATLLQHLALIHF
ncbi:hypothetical protein LLB_3267 [Legionella longbeachae D-4968]|nr:hypothetical protein LLB_3267 [Legionella longbeachae D-4968]